MMKQRRRMLAKQINISDALASATYIASAGRDESEAEISTTLSLDTSSFNGTTVYYVFGYYSNSFVIYKFQNSTLTKLFQHYASSTELVINYNSSTKILKMSYTKGYKFSWGMTVLTFDDDMDNVFRNLSSENIAGNTTASRFKLTRTISDFVMDTDTWYVFTGNSYRFCIYKAEGTTYSELTALFNHGLYLLGSGTRSVVLAFTTSATSGSYVYGYTMLSVKE